MSSPVADMWAYAAIRLVLKRHNSLQ